MRARHLPSFEFQRERWRNGAGWTREILSAPGHGAAFAWRTSIAEIEHDCRFSTFPGCERQLILLSGDGARLQFDDGRETVLDPPHGRATFAGEDAPHCIVSGRVQVFNLIADRNAVDIDLLHRPLVGPMVFFPEPAVQWLLYLISGRAELPDAARRVLLEQGDALLLTPEPEAPSRLVLSGGGEVLLARITTLSA